MENEREQNIEEMWKTHHTYMKMKTVPFTLKYMSYAKCVWVLGYHRYIPPLIKNQKEPNPFPTNINFVPLMEIQQLQGYTPNFDKEYFHKENKERIEKYYVEPEARCLICWLHKKGNVIDNHPPEPKPFLKCRIKKKPRHFQSFIFVNGFIKVRPERRKCVLDKKYTK